MEDIKNQLEQVGESEAVQELEQGIEITKKAIDRIRNAISTPEAPVVESETQAPNTINSLVFKADLSACDWDSYFSQCVGLTDYSAYASCGTAVGCGNGINFSNSYLAVAPGAIQAPLPCSAACTALCEQTYTFNKQLFNTCFTQTCGCQI